jgi:hypothetical protein
LKLLERQAVALRRNTEDFLAFEVICLNDRLREIIEIGIGVFRIERSYLLKVLTMDTFIPDETNVARKPEKRTSLAKPLRGSSDVRCKQQVGPAAASHAVPLIETNYEIALLNESDVVV